MNAADITAAVRAHAEEIINAEVGEHLAAVLADIAETIALLAEPVRELLGQEGDHAVRQLLDAADQVRHAARRR